MALRCRSSGSRIFSRRWTLVTDPVYTRRYFSDGARRWLTTAYVDGATYPLGTQRGRLVLTLVVDRLRAARGRLVDVGCGGGDLCFGAAEVGFETLGVDIAEGMIAEARRRAEALPPDVRARLEFRVGDALALGDESHSLDAVTALGLVEYLDTDAAFFGWAARRLRPGGVLVVSCRNRLLTWRASTSTHAASTSAERRRRSSPSSPRSRSAPTRRPSSTISCGVSKTHCRISKPPSPRIAPRTRR